jgi:multidrug efflux system outer membrane protein
MTALHASLHRASAIALTLLLAGCALGPDYRRPEAALPGQFAEAPASEPGPAIQRNWWMQFNDPVLDELVAKALAANTDVQAAAARVEEADAVLRETGGALFPEVDLGANAKRSRSSTVAGTLPSGSEPLRNNFNSALSTSFELDFWGKLRRASEAARAQALGTRYGRDTVELTLVGNIVRGYLTLRALDAQLAVSRASLDSREASLRITRSRLQGGLASELDVRQAEAASAALRAQIATLGEQRATTEHLLARLTGQLDLALAPADLRQLPALPLPPAGLPSALLEERPDVRQAEASLVAANASIGVAKAALFPSITLTGSFGSESKDLSDLFSSAARIWSLGLGLDLPIFDAGKRAARLDQASAQQKQALAAYIGAVRGAFTEVRDALAAVSQRREADQALQQQVAASTRALELAEARYRAGYSAYIEVLDAQRTANDAALSLIANRQSSLSAAVDLYAALGGGWARTE